MAKNLDSVPSKLLLEDICKRVKNIRICERKDLYASFKDELTQTSSDTVTYVLDEFVEEEKKYDFLVTLYRNKFNKLMDKYKSRRKKFGFQSIYNYLKKKRSSSIEVRCEKEAISKITTYAVKKWGYVPSDDMQSYLEKPDRKWLFALANPNYVKNNPKGE